MKKLILFIVLSVLLLVLKAQNPNPNSALDSYILGEMSTEHNPGMSTLIVKDGEIVWIESYGMADVDNSVIVTDSTVFLLASVSKLFTGTALMKLYQDGLIDLDEDINNYLPFNINNPNYPADSITFRMLMTHTSSIKDNNTVLDTYYSIGDPTIALADIIQRYFDVTGVDYDPVNNFHNNAPNTFYDYSNIATALSGYLVELVSGMPFSEYCNINIFDKLCMKSTSWYYSDFDSAIVARPHAWSGSQYTPYTQYGFADYPDGQLRSSITDMANFVIAYLQDGTFNSQQILNASSVNEMLTLQVPTIESTQGLNWYTEQIFLSGGGTQDVWGHNGGENGVSTDLYINPINNIGIVVLSNGEGNNMYVVDELYDYALSLSATGVGNPDCNPTTINEIDIAKTFEFNIYPNPSSGKIKIESSNEMINELVIFNCIGQVVETKKLNKQNAEILIKEKGIYLMMLNNKAGENSTKKFIIE